MTTPKKKDQIVNVKSSQCIIINFVQRIANNLGTTVIYVGQGRHQVTRAHYNAQAANGTYLLQRITGS